MLNRQEIIQNIKDIPPLKDVILESLQLMDNPDCDITKVEKVITRDLALTTRILSVANSPFYLTSGKVSSIKDAFMRVGLGTTRNIVMTAGVLARFPSSGGAHLNHLSLWEHNLGVGIAAQKIAEVIGADGQTAFTAGLLHDIGKFVLDLNFPKYYEKVVAFQKENNCTIRNAELHIIGVDHAMAGSELARRWNISEDLATVIQYHHIADESNDLMTHIVYVADCVAKIADIGFGGDKIVAPIMPSSLTLLGISEEAIRGLVPEICSTVDAARVLIST